MVKQIKCKRDLRSEGNFTPIIVLFFILMSMSRAEICSNFSGSGYNPCEGSCNRVSFCVIDYQNVTDCNPNIVQKWVSSNSKTIMCVDQYNSTPVELKTNLSGEVSNTFYGPGCSYCDVGNCSGTPEYCQIGNCNQSNLCSCQVFHLSPKEFYNDRDDFQKVTVCYGENWMSKRNLETSLRKRANVVNIRWNQPELEIFSTDPQNTYVILLKTGLTDTLVSTSSRDVFTLPQVWYDTTEPIVYTVYYGKEIIEQGQLAVEIILICEIPDCVFCDKFSKAFQCFTPAVQTMTVFFFIFFAVCLILSIIVIVMCIRASAAGMSVQVKLPSEIPLGAYTTGLVMVACLLMIPVGAQLVPPQQCDYGFSLSSSMSTCVINQGQYNCTVNGNLLMTFPYPGLIMCYDLISDGNVVQTISANMIEVAKTINNNLYYWTSSWEPLSQYNSMCAGADGCRTGYNCATLSQWTGTTLARSNGLITGPVSTVPGITKCLQSCGCINCDCVSCDQSCIHARCGCRAIGNRYRVLKPSTFTTSYTVRICNYAPGQNATCNKQTVSTNQGIQVSQGIFTIIGSFQGPATMFDSNAFIMRSDGLETFYGPVATPSLPVAQGVGDIQASTENSLLNININSYQFPTDLCDININGRTAIFSFLKPGFALTQNMIKLPNIISGVNWVVSNSIISGADPNPGAIVASFTFPNVTYSIISRRVCPKIEVINSTGCYLCPNGFSMYVRASSSCDIGTCQLTSNDEGLKLNTQSLLLDTDDKTFKVIGTQQLKQGSMTLSCHSLEKESSDSFDFDLYDPIPILNENGTVIGYYPGEGTVQNYGASNFWNGLDVGETVGFVIGMIVCAIILFLLVSLLGYLIYLEVTKGTITKATNKAVEKVIERVKGPYDEILQDENENLVIDERVF